MSSLAQRCQSGKHPDDQVILNLLSQLYLGPKFFIIKKHCVSAFLGMNVQKSVTAMEDQIVEFICSDDFEQELTDVLAMNQNMRDLEFKIIAYLDLCNKLGQLHEDVEIKHADDFVKVVQSKFQLILEKNRPDYLLSKGFVMNHSFTKALVEFLNSYNNFLNKFIDRITMEENKIAYDFV